MLNFILESKSGIFLLFFISLVLKIILAIYFSQLYYCTNPDISLGYLAKAAGDTFSYIGAMENLVTEGTFYFWNGIKNVYSGRMPHYGVPYFLFRLFFEKETASDCVVLLQIVFDTLATVYFAKLCRNIFKNNAAFWFGFAVYFLSFNYFATALKLFTESFTLSFMVLFFYAFQKYWNAENKRAVWTANVFLSFTVLLKVYLAPVYAGFYFIYIYREGLLSPGKLKKLVLTTFLLGLPFLLTLAPWLIRNLIVTGQPVITQEGYLAGYNYTPPDLAFEKFSAGWGSELAFWDTDSAACYFHYDPPFPCKFTFPSYSFTKGYTLEEVEKVRADYIQYQRTGSPELEAKVVREFDRLTEIYAAERPFMYYVGSGFIRVKTMIWHTNNYNLPIHAGSPCFRTHQIFFKLVQFAVYALALVLGLPAIIWLTLKGKLSVIYIFVPVASIAMIAFYARFAEARYLDTSYPVLLLGLTAVLSAAFYKLKKIIVRREWFAR